MPVRTMLWAAAALLVSLVMLQGAYAQSTGGSGGSGGGSGLSAIVQQLLQNGTLPSPNGGTSSTQPPQTQVIQAPAPSTSVAPPSRLELIFSDRANLPLRQFGYDVFNGLNQVTVTQVGMIQDYYVLGPGDSLEVDLRGQSNATYTVTVDNDGNVLLPLLSPLHAAGHTFAQFRAALQAAVKKAYIATDAFVSVTQLRRINVTVTGEVNAPGVKTLTGLSTPFDALVLSLGVTRSGSLRNIEIVRSGQVITYDLYHLLMNDGQVPSVYLNDGDRIVVMPVGKSVAISGWVRRPGIYEVPPGRSTISLEDLVKLGGGLQVRGAFRYSLMTTLPDGRLGVENLSSLHGTAADGDILSVEPTVAEKTGSFEFFGPTSLAGEYSLNHYHTLYDLLSGEGAAGQAPYMLMGLIARKDPKTLGRYLVPFCPLDIRSQKTNVALVDGDIVRVFDQVEAQTLINAVTKYTTKLDVLDAVSQPTSLGSAEQIIDQAQHDAVDAAIFGQQTNQSLGMLPSQQATASQPVSANLAAVASAVLTPPTTTTTTTGAAPTPQAAQTQVTQESNDVLSQSQKLQQAAAGPFVLDQRTSSVADVPVTAEAPNVAALALQIGVDPTVLISFLSDRRVSVAGAVRNEGVYLIGSSITLDDLLTAAGGPLNWADMSKVQLTRTVTDSSAGRAKTTRDFIDLHTQSLASIQVLPRDQFEIAAIPTDVDIGSVGVEGEVRNPGTFALLRGERLSQLMAEAGGLTPQAYPYGAVFLRKSVARRQDLGFQRTANDLQQQLIAGLSTSSSAAVSTGGISPDAAAFLGNLIDRLRQTHSPGRMTITAEPAAFAVHPDLDILLEPGDLLIVPPRPADVSVVGEVLNPGSYTFKSDLDTSDYVDLAGGFGRYADEGEVFVIYPDGTAHNIEESIFDILPDRIPPGSTIVVPRDLTPLDIESLVVDVSKVISDLATAGAALAVINRTN